jgi:glycine hydroxymethyltransferase
MILTNDEDLAKKINSAVFPGLQGGPLMHVIAAKAVAFGEALKPEFKNYARRSSTTPRRWPQSLLDGGCDSSRAAPTPSDAGRPAPRRAHRQGRRAGAGPRLHHLQQERHSVRSRPLHVTSGIRLGTPAGTTRGFGARITEFRRRMAAGQCLENRQACEGPDSTFRVERMVSGIVRRLESLGESEIKSETVGKLVMEALKMLDDVAYVRFASVYKNFREAKDFEELLGELSGEDDNGETGDN